MLKTASINRRTISENFFETLPEPKKEEENVGFHKLFSHRTLAIRTCVLYVNWYSKVIATFISLALTYFSMKRNGKRIKDQREKRLSLCFTRYRFFPKVDILNVNEREPA